MAQNGKDITKQRMLRMTLAHYKNEDCSEEEMHRFVTEDHAVHAAKIHHRHGMEHYAISFSPASFRAASKKLNESLGDRWVVRDYDVQVEFYFRDASILPAVAADPDFHKLQQSSAEQKALEGPIVSRLHVEQSISWVETYIQDGNLVNVAEDGKPTYPKFAEMSVAPSSQDAA